MISSKLKSILILGSFSKGALEHQFVRGLKAHGWNVMCVDIQESVNQLKDRNIGTKVLFNISPNNFLKNINQQVIQFAEEKKPAVILVFKGMELWPKTIEELKYSCKILCNYNADHPFNFYSKGAGNENVAKSINFFDFHFSYSKSICLQLKNKYHIDCHCIPFGYDETIVPVKRYEEYITDLFLFIGAWDKERETKLKNLSSIPLQIFGPSLWKNKINNFGQLKYRPKALYEQEYANACLNSAGVLNFLRPQNIIEQSHNMRTFEVPGYGGLLLAERTEEQLEFFEENQEAIYFHTLDELKDKLTYLIKNPNVVNDIKYHAKNRAVKSGYGYFNRSEQLINILDSYF